MALTNICQDVKLMASMIPDDASTYTYYTIKNGDRPDVVSYNLYGDVQYYWTFFILNESLRAGLNGAWPLSYYALDKMIESEYGPYSAITFEAQTLEFIDKNGATKYSSIDGTGDSDFALTPLDEKYLPYLRLTTGTDTSSKIYANILKYDIQRQQLVIHNIVDANGNSFSRDAFLANSVISYKLSWNESIYDTDQNGNPVLDETGNFIYINNIALKDEWFTLVLNNIKAIDKSGYDTVISTNSDLEQYVFGKNYIPVNNTLVPYRWSMYYNASHTIYNQNGITESIYNILLDQKLEIPQIIPSFISFQDMELSDNEERSNIKIIRNDKITDFSNSYFSILNS